MHSTFLSFLLVAATATFCLASPSAAAAPVLSRRSGPLAKQRLHSRAASLKHSPSSPSAARVRTRRSAVPMIESLEERNMLEQESDELEMRRRGLLDGLTGSTSDLPGSSVLGLVNIQSLLTTATSGMTTHQKKIASLAKKARTYKDSHMGTKFQNSVYQELKAYRGSAESLPGLKELDTALKPLGPDQGLGNFNRNDAVQVLLRTVNESTQNTLESTNLLVYYVPVLGPLVGPILYDIKCIIDDILNAAQYNTDGLLNQLIDQPGLELLSSKYATSYCKMAPSLTGC
ncbi:hypothetical protein JCM21900_000767 [Sporobolomyces salmonicolor]